MPKSLPPDDPDIDAAIDAWERGQGASALDHSDPAYEALRRAFLDHPDIQALDAEIAAAQADGQAIEAHTVYLPSGLTRLLAYVERLDARAAGRSPADVRAILERIVLNILENHLHGLTADPISHPHFARLWHRLCTEAGHPEFTLPDQMAPSGPQEAAEGPF